MTILPKQGPTWLRKWLALPYPIKTFKYRNKFQRVDRIYLKGRKKTRLIELRLKYKKAYYQGANLSPQKIANLPHFYYDLRFDVNSYLKKLSTNFTDKTFKANILNQLSHVRFACRFSLKNANPRTTLNFRYKQLFGVRPSRDWFSWHTSSSSISKEWKKSFDVKSDFYRDFKNQDRETLVFIASQFLKDLKKMRKLRIANKHLASAYSNIIL